MIFHFLIEIFAQYLGLPLIVSCDFLFFFFRGDLGGGLICILTGLWFKKMNEKRGFLHAIYLDTTVVLFLRVFLKPFTSENYTVAI